MLFLNRYNQRNQLVWFIFFSFLAKLKQLFNLTPEQTICDPSVQDVTRQQYEIMILGPLPK